MVTPKTEATTDTETKNASEDKLSSFTAKNELVENFLKNSSKLSNEERVAFLEKYLDEKNDGDFYKTSAGTVVRVNRYDDLKPPHYTLSIDPKGVDSYSFNYDLNGNFKEMTKFHNTKDGTLLETSNNLWAEKWGDSFIKDITQNNK